MEPWIGAPLIYRLLACVILLGLASCSSSGALSALGAKRSSLILRPVSSPHLDNLLRVSPRVFSGAEPQGAASFRELSRLGVTTVVSVDGAVPDARAAREHGLRTVHIPIGYDGIDRDAALSLVRVMRDSEGPVYVHCHHGLHRGPAAAAVACIAGGETDRHGARQVLEVAGTSREYGGLWRAVEAFRPPPDGVALPDLVERVEVDSLTAAMAAVDRAFERLELCRDAQWATPARHPDLVPGQEALLVAEGLHEARRLLPAEADADLRTRLSEAESVASILRKSLTDGEDEQASSHLEALKEACQSCHARHRDR